LDVETFGSKSHFQTDFAASGFRVFPKKTGTSRETCFLCHRLPVAIVLILYVSLLAMCMCDFHLNQLSVKETELLGAVTADRLNRHG